MADGRHFKNRYIAISQRKIIRFSWNFVHSSRFWTDFQSIFSNIVQSTFTKVSRWCDLSWLPPKINEGLKLPQKLTLSIVPSQYLLSFQNAWVYSKSETIAISSDDCSLFVQTLVGVGWKLMHIRAIWLHPSLLLLSCCNNKITAYRPFSGD